MDQRKNVVNKKVHMHFFIVKNYQLYQSMHLSEV